MHSPDKIQQLFDLRSRGNCLSYISRTIDVPISTLSDWNRRLALDIDAARACKWEAAEQAVKFNTEADLVRVIQRIDAFERELDRRSPQRMSVGELVRVIFLWRREYFRRRDGLLRSIEHPIPIPESESEKTGIPESHPPTFSPAPHAAAEANTTTNLRTWTHAVPARGGEGQGEGDSPALNSQPSTLNSSPPRLFSIEDHLPTPTAEWLPDDDQILVYQPRQPAVQDNEVFKKTNIASLP